MAWLLTGCTGAAFLAANIPSAFGSYQHTDDIAYGTDPRQKLDVYLPDLSSRDAAAGPRPVVVFFYGGGWRSGSKAKYQFVGSSLAKQGIVAVLADFRLNPEVRFPVFVEDAAKAVAWTMRNIDKYGGDPARVFVMGHSAGAHIALLLTLDRRYLAAEGSSADRLRGAIGISGPYDFKIDSDSLRAIFGSVDDLRQTQPINFARGDAPPLLLIHGADDWTVWDQHSIRLSDRIRAAGGQAELLSYPGIGHTGTIAGFSWLGRRRAATLSDVSQFVNSH